VTDERVVRTSARTGVRVDGLLTTALLGELLTPSPRLWLVSPWIGDVPAIDNRAAAFDAVFPNPSSRIYSLSEVLAGIVRAGSRLSVVTRPAEFNRVFLDRLERQTDSGLVEVFTTEDVHEKTLCGADWLISGSMNFTYRGIAVNDEMIHYRVDQAMAAHARADFERRFTDRNGAAW
jgi:hypothetical protein